MTEMFLGILNMSINASYIIIIVLALRLAMRNVSKKYICILWMIVLFRLLCPWTVESTISLLPSAKPISMVDFIQGNTSVADMGNETDGTIEKIPEMEENDMSGTDKVMMSTGTNTGEKVAGSDANWNMGLMIPKIAAIVWSTGVSIFVVYTLVILVHFTYKLKTAVPDKTYNEKVKIYRCEYATPFVVGIICSRIYIPFQVREPELSYVLLHEKTHISRKDHWLKGICHIALIIHWFNPLVWIMYKLVERDMEMACDEAVLAKIGGDSRAEYCEALLNLATVKKQFVGNPVAFGESDVKLRIKNLLNYKKPYIWITLLVIIIIGVIAVGFMSNPIENTNEEEQESDDIPVLDEGDDKGTENDEPIDEKVIRTDLSIKQATITEWEEGEETNGEQIATDRFMSIPWDKVVKNAKRPYANDWLGNIILMNEIHEHNISMYGYNDEEYWGMGVAVEHDENVNYFDWLYMDNHTIVPSIFWDDAHKQLQVILHTGSGTGYLMPSLHILQEYETMHMEDYCFEVEDVQKKLQERIGYTYDDEGLVLRVIDLQDNTELYVVDFESVQKYDDVSKESPITEVRVGDIFSYELGENIQMTFTVGYIIKGQEHMVRSQHVPEFKTTVTMDGDGEFAIGDITVVSEE